MTSIDTDAGKQEAGRLGGLFLIVIKLNQRINSIDPTNSVNSINFYPVKFFVEKERSEFNRGNQPIN
jgi:hypothetical protein